jgi:hypothetical protein
MPQDYEIPHHLVGNLMICVGVPDTM